MPMPKPLAASKATRAAELEIDGKRYRLVYSFNAIADAEEKAKCNLLHGLSATMLNSMTAAQLRGLLYAALQPEQPDITLEQAAALIRLDTMPPIIEAIGKAFVLSMPEPKNPTGAVPEGPAN